ncbi:hypothetical protein JNW90_26460 [Micromonospora sp. STR1s_5]|nr:hypothetical protein [Micromonospora sp. STR1s_5]
MAEIVRLPLGAEPPQDGDMVLLTRTVSGLYSCEALLRTGERSGRHEIFDEHPFEDALASAVGWADESGIAAVYVSGLDHP